MAWKAERAEDSKPMDRRSALDDVECLTSELDRKNGGRLTSRFSYAYSFLDDLLIMCMTTARYYNNEPGKELTSMYVKGRSLLFFVGSERMYRGTESRKKQYGSWSDKAYVR